MNPLIETLNRFGERAIGLAPEILLQTSLLVLVVLGLDLVFRRRLRASVRYGLWLLVLLKLCLPPSLAFPTGIGWWVRSKPPESVVQREAVVKAQYESVGVVVPGTAGVAISPALPQPAISVRAWAFALWPLGMVGLLSAMIVRCARIARMASGGTPPDLWVEHLMHELMGSHRGFRHPQIRLIDAGISPALFGMIRPTILLPRSIVTELNPSQLRMVLLHELIHLNRGDLWINCAQSLLQVLYWWHPLVWYANSRLRQLREEAVDDAVMRSGQGEPQDYAATLLKVASVAVSKLRPTVGLVGILEPSTALSRRIRRIVNGHPRTKSRFAVLSIAGIATLGAIAIPMGERPPVPQAAILNQVGTPMPPEIPEASNSGASGLVAMKEPGVISGQGSATQGMAEQPVAQTRENSLKESDTSPPPPSPAPQSQPASGQPSETVSELSPSRGTQSYRMPYTGRYEIQRQLMAIRLRKVEFNDQRLEDVAKDLLDLVRENDPNGKGIDFHLDQSVLPREGLTKSSDLAGVIIHIHPALVDIRLTDLLEAIVKVADKPICYGMDDSGIVFSLAGNGKKVPLYLRAFKVDSNTFGQTLIPFINQPNVAGSANIIRTNDIDAVQDAVRALVNSWGISAQSLNALYYNSRQGTLLVRAGLEELNRIEAALSATGSAAPAPVNRLEGASKPGEPPGVPAPSPQPQIIIHATFIELPEPALRSRRLKLATNSIPRLWNPSELEALKKIKDADVLALQQVTTLSGRRAIMQIAETKTVVNGIKWPVPTELALADKPATNTAMTPTYLTDTISVGPSLDVLPVLREDGKTIELDMTAKVTEFLGYDDDRSPGTQVHVPLPHFRINSVSAHGKVSAGECLLLPVLKSTDLSSKSDARSEMNPGRKPKAILVFVRATLLPGGGSKDQPK